MDVGLLILRIVVGALFVGHGTQKLFGWFGGYGVQGTGGWLAGMASTLLGIMAGISMNAYRLERLRRTAEAPGAGEERRAA